MSRDELNQQWTKTLRDANASANEYERLAHAVLEMYESGDGRFREHIKNRFGRISKTTGQAFDADDFDLDMARAFVADEIGFASWDELIDAVSDPSRREYPILFEYAIAALWRGDFTALENRIGGPDAFDKTVIDWFEKAYLSKEPETLAETFAAACMLGHPRSAEYLLDEGVDPYAGMRTGLAGFHYAASSGRLEIVKLLTERKVPMEVENMYGGTVLGQALWSAINEHTPQHAEIIEVLIEGGAYVWPKTLEWWEEQDVPSDETKSRVADVLRRASSK